MRLSDMLRHKAITIVNVVKSMMDSFLQQTGEVEYAYLRELYGVEKHCRKRLAYELRQRYPGVQRHNSMGLPRQRSMERHDLSNT